MNSRDEMVYTQIAKRGISSPLVIDAMRRVHRDKLIPVSLKPMAYSDTPLPIGCGQTISQPYIVALMTELIEPQPQYKVLELGTGSGYQAAVLAEIVKEVYTVEIISELAEKSKQKLVDMGYTNIHFKNNDGTHGWEKHSPYDGIIVTAAAEMIPCELKEQLKIGAKMVIPVGREDEVQCLWVVTRTGKDEYKEEPNIYVRFVPVTHQE